MPAVRQPVRFSHVAALLGLAALTASSVWLGWWGWLLLRALFLPGNLQRLLHVTEVAVFSFLAIDLLLLVLPALSKPRIGVRIGTGRGYPIERRLIVGSAPGLRGLRVLATEISRRHCELTLLSGGRLAVRDLGSTNGTFLDGEDLRDRGAVPLRPGARVELGRGAALLEAVELPPRALLGAAAWTLLLSVLLAIGLVLGGLANRELLPEAPLVVGEVTVPFAAARTWTVIGALGFATATVLGLWSWAARRGGAGSPAAFRAIALLVVVGQVLLLPLLPAVALRYAEAAQRAHQELGAADWGALERWEKAGGELKALRCADSSWNPSNAPLLPPLPALTAPAAEQRQMLCRYRQGRESLRWAATLSGAGRHPLLGSTYFRQSAVTLGAVLLGFVPVLLWSSVRLRLGHWIDALGAPVVPALVRAADRGSRLARALRPFAYRDLLLGFTAAGLVALTLAVGSTRGRGKTLFLDLPGLPSLQTLELVKALFVLFLAGYFARQGDLIASVPRRRYLVPYLVAVVATLGLTAAQADMGGLMMLGLFLALLFVGATGSFRLLLTVPLLLLPGLALAVWAGKATILRTRLELWLAPRDHPFGEQLVQARQLLLSSGWSGYLPSEARAARIADVQGDLVLAALAERFGALGVLALLAAVAVLGVALLRAARAVNGPRRLLLGGFAALLLVQFATQAGGLFGLLPLTGVPLPWLSQGLTASLVFTLLAALALAVAPESGVPPSGSRRRDPLLHLARSQAAALGALGALALYWIVGLPVFGDVGALGARYRWQDPARTATVERAIAAGRFATQPASDRVELAPQAGSLDSPTEVLQFAEMAEGLRLVAGEIRPLPWLVSNPNHFADRSPRRGWLIDRRGEVFAMSDRRGNRIYPQGAAAFHPVGRASGRTVGRGIEEAARRLLAGHGLPTTIRLRAFAEDIHTGPDLRLTLDAGLEREAFAALAGRPGGVVAIALPSGAVLASASSPAIDPGGVGVEEWRSLLRRPGGRPLLDRALRSTERYSPPGSAFKLVMAAAILTSPSGFDPNRSEDCTGYDPELHVACAHGHAHGRVDLARALTVSCNIYFARAAVRLGEAEIRRAAERFGLNAPASPNLLRGLPGAELRPMPSTVLPEGGPRLRARDLARVGYGQGPVSLTPFDLARAGAVIATGGERIDPYLAQSIELSRDEEGERSVRWDREVAAVSRERVLPELAAEQIDLVLRGVFESPEGTGRNLPRLWHDGSAWRLSRDAPGEGWERVPLAGKTGSAWRAASDATDDAWMVVWAPAGAPRVVVAVQIEDGGEGGKTAGPIALSVLRSALERLDAERAAGESAEAVSLGL